MPPQTEADCCSPQKRRQGAGAEPAGGKNHRRHSDDLPAASSTCGRRICFGGASVCEIGARDCLAAAAIFVAKAPAHVDLVELIPRVLNESNSHPVTLRDGISLSLDVLSAGAGGYETEFPVTFLTSKNHMNIIRREPAWLVFSHHGWNTWKIWTGMFASAYRALRPAAGCFTWWISAGRSFEDPFLPWIFQTYPDWLSPPWYPIHHRNTRVLWPIIRRRRPGRLSSRLKSVQTQLAEKNYARSLQPDLRPAARRAARRLRRIEFIDAIK